MNSAEVERRIDGFLRSEFHVQNGDPGFGRSVDLFDGGYVDSIGFAELLAFLSEEFDVEVPEAELLSDDFTHIEGIARTVVRLKAAA